MSDAATIDRVLVQVRLRSALQEAFRLGQDYWRQADSESYKQNALADVTLEKFNSLISETMTLVGGAA